MIKGLRDSLLSLMYPQPCGVCRQQVESLDDGAVCRDCWEATRIFTGSEMLCSKCGAFFAETAAPVAVFCHKCDDHFYEKAFAVGIYEKALSASIIGLKSTPAIPQTLRKAMRSTVERIDLGQPNLLMPVPLSKLRRIERGFNQAEIIAAELSAATGIPVDSSSLVRKLHTPIHRVGMDQKARELTVKNAFEAIRPKLLKNKRILLVDDVFTSGATASFCAKVLKRNGCASVNVFTLARAVLS